MIKKTFIILALVGAILTSCKKEEKTKKETATEEIAVETPDEEAPINEAVIETVLTNDAEEGLEVSFDLKNGTASFTMGKKNIILKGQIMDSGIVLYTNGEYEITTENEIVELKKDGKVIFRE